MGSPLVFLWLPGACMPREGTHSSLFPPSGSGGEKQLPAPGCASASGRLVCLPLEVGLVSLTVGGCRRISESQLSPMMWSQVGFCRELPPSLGKAQRAASSLLSGRPAGHHLGWEGPVSSLTGSGKCLLTAQTVSSLPPRETHTLYSHTIPHTLKKIGKKTKYFPCNCHRQSVGCCFSCLPDHLGAVFSSFCSALGAGLDCGRSNYSDTASPATVQGNMRFYLHPDFERACVPEVYLSRISLLGRVCSCDLKV